MLKMTLFVGLNDQNTKKQMLKTEVCEQLITYALLKVGFDATISLNKGIYTNRKDFEVDIENSFKIELLCFEDEVTFTKKVKNVVLYLKDCFNQQSIAVTREYVDSQLW